mgnify:CR=1 FL=1
MAGEITKQDVEIVDAVCNDEAFSSLRPRIVANGIDCETPALDLREKNEKQENKNEIIKKRRMNKRTLK